MSLTPVPIPRRRSSIQAVDYLTPTANSPSQLNLACLSHGQNSQYICTFKKCNNRLLCTECASSHPEAHKRSITLYKDIFGSDIFKDIEDEIQLNTLADQNNEVYHGFLNQLQLALHDIRKRIDKTMDSFYQNIKEKVIPRIIEPVFPTKEWEALRRTLTEKKARLEKATPSEMAKCMDEYLRTHAAVGTALLDAENGRDLEGGFDKNNEESNELIVDQEAIDETILGLRNLLNKLYGKISNQVSPLNTPAENIEVTKAITRNYKSSIGTFHLTSFYTRPTTKTYNTSYKAISVSTTSLPNQKEKINDRTMPTKFTTDNYPKKTLDTEGFPSPTKINTIPFIYDEYVDTAILDLPYVGPIKLADESSYKGQMKGGKPHGKGKQAWKDGKRFEGYYEEGSIQGKGRMVHPDGDIYEGQWERGLAHGQGKYKRADGWVYEGEWMNDQPFGNGVETWADSTKYEGQYKNGMKHGKGTLKCADGSWYQGDFKDNMFDGDGVYVWPDGRKYEGDWVKNMREGKGIMTWPDGKKYNGQFEADNRDGYGTFEWGDGRKYVGCWRDGKPHGPGRLQNQIGEVMEGDWKQGTLGKQGQYAAISIKDLKSGRDLGLNKSGDLSDSKISFDKMSFKGFESPGQLNNCSVRSVAENNNFGRKKERNKTAIAAFRPELKIVIKGLEEPKPYGDQKAAVEQLEKEKKANKNVDIYMPVGFTEDRERFGGYKIQIHEKNST